MAKLVSPPNKKIDQSNILTTEKVKEIQEKERLALPLKLSERLWFKNNTGIRRPGLKFSMTQEELEEYIKCKLSVYYFAEHYCKIKLEDGSIGQMRLRDYQKDIIKLYTENRYSILMASRQSGKTVSAAIVMLWTVLFNKDKGVMIVANKSTTVKEIVRKIKDIYKLLPFFLKTGIVNWNEKTLAFENGSRIQSENRTKEPAIGFTIDLLYLDEFAKIPDNIVRAYYASVVPTVSSISNSKIIITSTPDGHNLFWELLRDAELPEGDSHKNPYKSLKVYWFQIKGRRDTKFRLIDEKLKKFGLTEDYVMNYLRNELGYKLYEKIVDGQTTHYIKWYEDDEKTKMEMADITQIRQVRIQMNVVDDYGVESIVEIPLPEIAFITNWQEEETNLIGGEGKFEQEYGLQFITEGNLLFDSAVFEGLIQSETKFKHIQIPQFDAKLKLPYSELRWIDGRPDLFDISQAKNYNIFIGIDMGEGLGQNYTVISIFRLMMKDKDVIARKSFMFENKYDLFKLEQIGVFQNNTYNPLEIAHILYLIAFELFNPEKVKITLEKNKNLGDRLLSEMKHVFNENNNYGDSVFVRYKQNETDDYLTVGFLVKSGEKGKKLMLKDFQDAIKKDAMVLRHSGTITELSSFSKKELANGEVTYKSQSGTDDCVMAIINLATIYRHMDYKNIIDNYLDFKATDVEKEIVKKFLEITPYENTGANYKTFRSARKEFLRKTDLKTQINQLKPSPWQNKNDENFKRNPWAEPDPWKREDPQNPLFWPNSQKIKFWPKND